MGFNKVKAHGEAIKKFTTAGGVKADHKFDGSQGRQMTTVHPSVRAGTQTQSKIKPQRG